jgi:hypothetical protein
MNEQESILAKRLLEDRLLRFQYSVPARFCAHCGKLGKEHGRTAAVYCLNEMWDQENREERPLTFKSADGSTRCVMCHLPPDQCSCENVSHSDGDPLPNDL